MSRSDFPLAGAAPAADGARPGRFGRWLAWRDEALFAVVALLSSVIALGGNLLAARVVDPADMGIIMRLMLVQNYLALLHLGVFSGLQRNVPLELGRGDEQRLDRQVAASWWMARWTALVGLAVGAGVVGVVLWLRLPMLHFWAAMAMTSTLVCLPFTTHFDVLYRSLRQFRRATWVMSVGAGLSALACLLPLWWGAMGLAGRYFFTALAVLAPRWWGNPRPVVVPMDRPTLGELIRIGFPIMVCSQLGGLFNVADRSVVAARMSEADLGMFQLASLVATGLQVLPNTLGMILLPRVARRYGETSDPASLRKFVWQGALVGLAAIAPAVLFFYFGMGTLARVFCPKYLPGVPAAEITCLSMLTFAASGVGAVITTLRGNTGLILVTGTGLALVWLGGWLAISAGAGIVGVAWVRFWAQCFYAAGMVGLAIWLTRTQPLPST